MPLSVPPSPPPAIVQPSLPDKVTPDSTDVRVLQTVQTGVLPTPVKNTVPERLQPESSPSQPSRSAVLLGPPISVSYPSNQLEIQTPSLSSTAEDAMQPASQVRIEAQANSAKEVRSLDASPKFGSETSGGFSGLSSSGNGEKAEVTPPASQTSPATPASPSSPTPPVTQRILELKADHQEYDQQRQILTAEGHVLLRFNDAVLNADRLQVNLANLIAVGQGNVVLTRGQQVLIGEQFTYNFIQESGQFLNARGEIFIPSAGTDLSVTSLPTDVTNGSVPRVITSDRVIANQPSQQVTSAGGLQVNVGGLGSNGPATKQGGQVRRLRFQAERVDFYPEGWRARNVRITNDPFSPPELELRADQVILTHETPLRDRIRTVKQRLVFDQGAVVVPIPRDEAVIDRSQRQVSPALAQLGIDGDKGGVFVERGFSVFNAPGVSLRLTPQFFLQRVISQGFNLFDPSVYGLTAKLNATLTPRTTVQGAAIFNSFDLSNLDNNNTNSTNKNNLRASLRVRQLIGNPAAPYTLALEYTFRNRLYNGSLGFQTVQSSVGGVLTSPIIRIAKTGVTLRYQVGAQYVNADTDRTDLLNPIRANNRISLGRFQGAVVLNRSFPLLAGKPLPPTPTQGLKYTPVPVVPYLAAYVGAQGVSSFYTSNDNQTSLTGTVGLVGQIGHFSRPFLDYTGFNISYSRTLRIGDLSPFLFDRISDTSVLSLGISQQIYGPIRLGIQTSLNLDTGKNISTDYIIEYSRRTYGILLRYNPTLGLGSLSLRISDFNWTGGTDPFSDTDELRPVVNGVIRQ